MAAQQSCLDQIRDGPADIGAANGKHMLLERGGDDRLVVERSAGQPVGKTVNDPRAQGCTADIARAHRHQLGAEPITQTHRA